MRTENADEGAELLLDLLHGGGRVLAMTGAGVSTESGIPDFRTPGGLWSRYKPIPFDEFVASPDARAEAWRRKFAVDDAVGPVLPARGHKALAHLVATGRSQALLTQNIDGLHQASGIADAAVIELHGNGCYATCLDCGARYELAWVRARLDAAGEAPACPVCDGPVKSATISFGQPMPQAAMRRATEETLAADVFLAVGSSLVVHPAADFPLLAKKNGASLVIVNREPTGLDPYADLVINADIGDALLPLLRLN